MPILLRPVIQYVIVLFCALLLVATNADAKRKKPKREFPRGCQQVGFSFMNDHLDLKPIVDEGDQTLYLFGNKTQQRVLIKYMELGDAFMVPDWHTVMQGNRWAAFATDKKQLYFKCSLVSRKGQLTPTNCNNVIRICQYPRAKFASHNMGNYWISQNKSRSGVVREAIQTGILLRW